MKMEEGTITGEKQSVWQMINRDKIIYNMLGMDPIILSGCDLQSCM